MSLVDPLDTRLRYFGDWSNYTDMRASIFWALDDPSDSYALWREFTVNPGRAPVDSEILLAVYSCDGYEGSALVYFERDGQLYEVEGSHCSCNGLECMAEEMYRPRNPIDYKYLIFRKRPYAIEYGDPSEKELLAVAWDRFLDRASEIESRRQ